MKNYNVTIASDHSGYTLKSEIIHYLKNQSLSIYDCGTDNSTTTVDYPDYAQKLVETIVEKTAPLGILISETGIGMSIAANRYSEIRAALCFDVFMAERARSRYNANILILSAKFSHPKIAYKIIDTFLATKFEGGRHATRLLKIK